MSSVIPQRLCFTNPKFFAGLNLDIRRGLTWARYGLEPGDKIVLCCDVGASHYLLGDARIFRVLGVKFQAIPEDYVQYYHTGEFNDLNSLYKFLKSIYSGFTDSELVSLIFFHLATVDPNLYKQPAN